MMKQWFDTVHKKLLALVLILLTIFAGTWSYIEWQKGVEPIFPESDGDVWVSDNFTDETKIASTWQTYVNTMDGHVRLADFEDPLSIVGMTQAAEATSLNFQRATFHANGRFWVFWTDGTNLVYSTSINGESWSLKTTIRSCTLALKFSITFNGSNVCYTYADWDTANTPIYYRVGVTNSSGDITWSTIEQEAVSAETNIKYVGPKVDLDSSGYPWIGYRKHNTTDSTHYPYVTKSSWNNGSWQTASGFPEQLSDPQAGWYVSMTPLTNQKMYVIYTCPSQKVKGKLWDGSWGSEENVTSSNIRAGDTHSEVAIEDDVYMVFLEATTYDIHFVKRTYGSGWGSEEDVALSEDSAAYPVISKTASSEVYCFWEPVYSEDNLYYRKRDTNGNWGSTIDWFSSSGMWGITLSCFYEAQNDIIGICWTDPNVNKVMYNFLQIETYKPTGLLYSTNLLSGKSVSSINAFNYTVSSLPAQTTLDIQFSQNNSTWYNSTGGSDWQSLSSGTNNTISLASLEWTSANFYYRCAFNNTDDSTPKLNYIAILYNTTFLVVGWNDFSAWSVDVGHTLGEINASLNADNVNWTIVSKYNGTYYTFVKDYHWNADIEILSTSDTIYVYCLEAGVWNHEYD